MHKHISIPYTHENNFFCFPESVGHYSDYPQHTSIRQNGEFSYFNLHIVTSGKGYLVSNGKTYTLQQGDAFLYFPNEQQHYFSDIDESWDVLWLHFYGSFLQSFFTENGFHISPVWSVKVWTKVVKAIELLLDEVENYTILHPSILSTLTYGIISEFISQAIPLTSNKGFDIYNKILDIIPLMREKSAEPFELKYWADKVNISTYYFCKAFKNAIGTTPTQFITMCRLQSAKQLLLNQNDLTVREIALKIGYPSISYFGSVFLKNEGITPNEYRKRFRLNLS